MSFSIKQDDTYPAFVVILKEDGIAKDVSGGTVTFNSWRKGSKAAHVTAGSCAFITDGTDGKVGYTFTAAQTVTPGKYEAEFSVDFGGGSIGTWPVDENIPFEIVAEIA